MLLAIPVVTAELQAQQPQIDLEPRTRTAPLMLSPPLVLPLASLLLSTALRVQSWVKVSNVGLTNKFEEYRTQLLFSPSYSSTQYFHFQE